MISLTDEERVRFAQWLEFEALTERGLIEQLKTLGPAMQMMVKFREAEMNASLLIAKKLRSTEVQSIGGKKT